MAAVDSGNVQSVRLLLGAGAAVDRPGRGGETPLMRAARSVRVEAARLLLDARAGVDARDDRGITALMRAVGFGPRLEMVKLLLAAGADPNTGTDSNSYCQHTALTKAVRHRSQEIVRALLEAGADPNLRVHFDYPVGWWGPSAVSCAAEAPDIHIVRLLLAAGADPTLTADPLIAVSRVGARDIAQLLLEAGAEVDARNAYSQETALIRAAAGGTALIRAATGGTAEVVRLLLQAGADVGARDRDAMTALHRAAAWDDLETVELLLKAGADVNARASNGSTPLMWAARVDRSRAASWMAADVDPRVAIITALLEAGAEVRARDSAGQTALSLAEQARHWPVVELLGGGARNP